MTVLRSIAGLIAVLSVLSACAGPSPPNVEHVPNPPPRYELRGYSVIPTKEPGWLILHRTSEQIGFGKRGASVDGTVAIRGALAVYPTALTVEELARREKALESEPLPPDRFRLLKFNVVIQAHSGASCVKVYWLIQDSAPVRRSSRTEPMEEETSELVCIHPKDPKTVVKVAYSQRRYPEDRDAAFPAIAEDILTSLEFADLPPRNTGLVNCIVGGKRTWTYDRSTCD